MIDLRKRKNQIENPINLSEKQKLNKKKKQNKKEKLTSYVNRLRKYWKSQILNTKIV
jgi:bisphosphoglycerate-dependent phosphoglycerate mutase